MFTEPGQFFVSSAASYEITQSIRFNDDDASYLYRDNSSAQTDTKKFTYSVWIKRCAITGGTNTGLLSGGAGTTAGRSDFIFTAGSATGDSSNNDALKFDIYTGGWTQIRAEAKLRDPAAWYHIVLVYDAANSTANDTLIMYANGSRLTLDSTSGVPNNLSLINANGQRTRVGADASGTPVEFDGYMANIMMIDGQALAPTAFAETNDDGVWVPIDCAGALNFGNNGFFIDGRDSSDLGDDESGNGNDFTSTGLAAADQMSDSPTNNHCTYNPLRIRGTNTLSNGNLQAAAGSAGAYVTSTFGVSSGKWYWEYTFTGTYNFPIVGIMDTTLYEDAYPSQLDRAVLYYSSNGNKYIDSTGSSYGASYAVSDKIGVALNLDDDEITFYKNNSTQGAISITNREYTPLAGEEGSVNGGIIANFGQSDFEYTPPTGFKALNTSNLDTPVIADSSAHFQTTLYTGNGSTQSITNGGNSDLQPDLVWIKGRGQAYDHALYDAVRGATKEIKSNATDAEATISNGVTAFASDGFALGDRIGVNADTELFVAWQWKESATAGFDIVTDTGTGSAHTISHSLGVTPELIMRKDRTATSDPGWVVWHKDLGGANYYLNLHDTGARDTSVNYWNNTLPTSSVFSVGSSNGTNQDTKTFVTYLFASVPSFSSLGSYVGNGNASGPHIFTGMTPEFLIVKRVIGGTGNWDMFDRQRDPINPADAVLDADANSVEASYSTIDIDFLSNGFKVR